MRSLSKLICSVWIEINLDTPTTAPTVPRALTLAQLLAYKRFSSEAKIGYLELNTPTACPPRTAVPVNTRARFRESVSTQHARFSFGQGCDRTSYVPENLARHGQSSQSTSFHFFGH
jgi:hypothetical protein